MTDVAQILLEREKTHGDYEQVARIAQGLKRVIDAERVELPATHRESLELIFTKVARIVSGNPSSKEHWDDIGGYAKLISDRCSQ
jgi:hypothetical protein